MNVKPHAGAGVEISEVDLRTIDDSTFTRIHALFVEHGLVFFRDQQLTEEDHIVLARRFGRININRFFPHHDLHAEIALVNKEPHQRGNVGGGWHTDHSYDLEPALGSLLVARVLPATGGDTCFVSMYSAFERLPERMKRKLRRLRARHSSKQVFGSRGALLRKLTGTDEQFSNPHLADAMLDPIHPVVIRHPLSGREALFVNPAFTTEIEGKGFVRSLPLLGYLYLHALRPRHIARFRWQPGSVVLWDNRATWHYAPNDYHGQRREMHRITLEGCALTAA